MVLLGFLQMQLGQIAVFLGAIALSNSDLGETINSGLRLSLAVAALLIEILSFFNLPIYRQMRSPKAPSDQAAEPLKPELLSIQHSSIQILYLNLGGGLLPLSWSILQFKSSSTWGLLLAIAVATIIAYYRSNVQWDGTIRSWAAWTIPLVTAVIALLFDRPHAIATATASSMLAMVIGADLLHLRHWNQTALTSPGALIQISIGGAGLLDSIVVAGGLAAMITTSLQLL